MFIVSLSLLKSDRQLNSPVYHNTVHCTVHTVRLYRPVSAWAGVKYQATSSVRPPKDVFFNSSIVCLHKYKLFIAAFIEAAAYCGKYDKTFAKQREHYLCSSFSFLRSENYGNWNMKSKIVSDIKLCWWVFNYIERWQK